MAEGSDGAERTEEPTPKKLEQARAQGDVPKTPELPQFASLAASASVLAICGGWVCRNIASALLPFLAHPDAIDLEGHGGMAVARYVVNAALPLMLTVLLAAGAAGAAGPLLQTGFMFTPGKLKPDFGKLSLLKGLQRMFGLDNLIQFAKSLVKVMITAALAWWMIKPHMAELQQLPTRDLASLLPFLADLLRRLG